MLYLALYYAKFNQRRVAKAYNIDDYKKRRCKTVHKTFVPALSTPVTYVFLEMKVPQWNNIENKFVDANSQKCRGLSFDDRVTEFLCLYIVGKDTSGVCDSVPEELRVHASMWTPYKNRVIVPKMQFRISRAESGRVEMI